MRTRHLSVCAMLVAGGCAHSHEATERHAQQSAQHSHTAENTGNGELAMSHDPASETGNPPSAERVELPTDRTHGPRLASSDTLPATPAHGAASQGAAADNTRVNERDRGGATLTPMDQGESEADRMLVQRIRKAVIADDSLSMTAKNVKIITRDGQVTLRGAVNNARENATLEKLAGAAAGPTRVTNQLEVSN